jgi:hypothetical protein
LYDLSIARVLKNLLINHQTQKFLPQSLLFLAIHFLLMAAKKPTSESLIIIQGLKPLASTILSPDRISLGGNIQTSGSFSKIICFPKILSVPPRCGGQVGLSLCSSAQFFKKKSTSFFPSKHDFYQTLS